MLPTELTAAQFAGYPPEARALLIAHLAALRQLPLIFAPSLLREAIDYDYKFPAERAAIDRELAMLSSLRPAQMQQWFQAFSRFALAAKFEHLEWVDHPAQFVEQLSAYLWTTHQMDAFREAAIQYGDRLQTTPTPLPVRRLGIAVIGQGVGAYDAPVFRKLHEHGTYFKQVKPENGLGLLLAATAARAKAHPVPYGHWYVDGGQAADHSPGLTCVSYGAMEPLRAALLKQIQAQVERPGMGPEELRTHLVQLTPGELGMDKTSDAVLSHFQVRLLTDGSGTQIFSTTFAQWTAREVLRRAQALTLMVRFAPRQQQRPMNEMLSNSAGRPELDPIGSLVDADMGAYYQWIDQQRLPGSEQSSFVAWFEGHSQAMAIGPSLPRGAESNSAVDLEELLKLADG